MCCHIKSAACFTPIVEKVSHLCHMMSSVTAIGLNCQSQWCYGLKRETVWMSMRNDCGTVASNWCALNKIVWTHFIPVAQSCFGVNHNKNFFCFYFCLLCSFISTFFTTDLKSCPFSCCHQTLLPGYICENIAVTALPVEMDNWK